MLPIVGRYLTERKIHSPLGTTAFLAQPSHGDDQRGVGSHIWGGHCRSF